MTVPEVAQGRLKSDYPPDTLHSFLRNSMISFPTRQDLIAELYDACQLILDTYRETDLFDVYAKEGLEDHINFAAAAREIMGLIAEGDLK